MSAERVHRRDVRRALRHRVDRAPESRREPAKLGEGAVELRDRTEGQRRGGDRPTRERTSTVVANAFIGPRVSQYIAGIDRHIRAEGFDGSFLVVQSTGGLFDAAQARRECIRMLESGPAAGVIGTRTLCAAAGRWPGAARLRGHAGGADQSPQQRFREMELTD